MDRTELAETLRQLLETETGEEYPHLDQQADLRTGLNLDSMDLVSLVFRIENRFKIRIDSERLAEVTTVDKLLDLLQEQIAESAARAA